MALGILNALQNKVNPAIGAVQGIVLESVAQTPFANSLVGAGMVGAAYAISMADLAEIDKAVQELLGG